MSIPYTLVSFHILYRTCAGNAKLECDFTKKPSATHNHGMLKHYYKMVMVYLYALLSLLQKKIRRVIFSFTVSCFKAEHEHIVTRVVYNLTEHNTAVENVRWTTKNILKWGIHQSFPSGISSIFINDQSINAIEAERKNWNRTNKSGIQLKPDSRNLKYSSDCHSLF